MRLCELCELLFELHSNYIEIHWNSLKAVERVPSSVLQIITSHKCVFTCVSPGESMQTSGSGDEVAELWNRIEIALKSEFSPIWRCSERSAFLKNCLPERRPVQRACQQSIENQCGSIVLITARILQWSSSSSLIVSQTANIEHCQPRPFIADWKLCRSLPTTNVTDHELCQPTSLIMNITMFNADQDMLLNLDQLIVTDKNVHRMCSLNVCVHPVPWKFTSWQFSELFTNTLVNKREVAQPPVLTVKLLSTQAGEPEMTV